MHSQLIISDDYVHALSDAAERETLHRHILANGISYRDDSIMVNGYHDGDHCCSQAVEDALDPDNVSARHVDPAQGEQNRQGH